MGTAYSSFFHTRQHTKTKICPSKDKLPKDKQSKIVYAILCQDQECDELYIGETKQTVAKRMYQHRRVSTSGSGDSAEYTHISCTKHSFENKDVVILDKEARWFERGVKEAIYVKREEPSLNRGGGLRHNLAGAYNTAIKKIPRRFNSSNRDNSTPSRVSDQVPLQDQSA